jgi:uncharacterized membrane protein YfcA
MPSSSVHGAWHRHNEDVRSVAASTAFAVVGLLIGLAIGLVVSLAIGDWFAAVVPAAFGLVGGAFVDSGRDRRTRRPRNAWDGRIIDPFDPLIWIDTRERAGR